MADPGSKGFSFFPIIVMWVTLGILPVIAWMAAAFLYEGLGLDWSRHLDGDLVLVAVALMLLYAGYLPLTLAAIRALGTEPLLRVRPQTVRLLIALPGIAAFVLYYFAGPSDQPELRGALGFVAIAIYGIGAVLAILVYLLPIGRDG